MYGTLTNQCHPRHNAVTNNAKFLPGNPPSASPVRVPVTHERGSADPTLWGPHLWAYLHYSAINYPIRPTQQQQQQMKNWLICLSSTIPCKNCSTHYSKYIRQHKQDLDIICSSRDTLFNFLVDIHNKVNKRNGKPEVSYKEARNIFKPRS